MHGLPRPAAPDRPERLWRGQGKCGAGYRATQQKFAAGERVAHKRVRLGDVAAGVLFIHSSAGRYGADLQLLALASGLDRNRFNPLAVLPERGQLADLLERAGVEVAIAPVAVLRRADLGLRSGLRLARRMRAPDAGLARIAREHDTAIVHSNTSVVLSGEPLASELGVPHVVHVRELYPALPLLWPAWRRQLLHADRLLCVSQAVAAQFEGSPNAVVVHDGLARVPDRAPREEARAALDLPPDAFVVAVLGRISDWKGQDLLAAALGQPTLRAIDAVGLVAGAPWPGTKRPLHDLERLRGEYGLGNRLRLLGFREDVDVVLGASDAVAVPSTRPDPFPNSALESAAAGVPVVAAAHGGLPEMLRDGETGLLVPPGDAGALARALRSLADDAERARRLGEAAAADVTARFTPQLMLERVQSEYDALLHPTERP